MRYQNWDVLVFPEDCKIPLQEFKTGCQVVQDPESNIYLQSGQTLLPTVTCFIPGLPAEASFRVSIHCWKDPDVSTYLQSLSKHADNAIFEARLLIDGRLSGSKFYGRAGPWPSVLETSIELNKHGEFEPLKFPTFHQELLTQSYWNAGDDLGRIKLVIAEGFPRDSMSMPFERVRNLVSFSFQHAPLEVLESSSIAWPNASMWRQVALTAPYFPRQLSPQASDDVDAHSHSPRRRVTSKRPSVPTPVMGSMAPPNMTTFTRQTVFDPFTEPVQSTTLHRWRHVSSSADVLMPDITNSNTRTNSSRRVTDPMITDKPDRRYETLQSVGAFESVCEALMPSVPVNTHLQEIADGKPAATIDIRKPLTKRASEQNSGVKVEIAATDVKSASAESSCYSPTIKSRKEKIQDKDHTSTGTEEAVRKVTQSFTKTTSSGSKRQRNATPAASKVIDDEDEPKSSPAMRKVSRRVVKQGEKEDERRVLSGIENV